MINKNLFSDGQQLDHDGHPLIIECKLSSGLTGEVYLGKLSLPNQPEPVKVAVKIMKALDFPLARQMFYKEGETLAFLMHLEDESRDLLDETLKIAPVYYGLSEYHSEPGMPGAPYIVMEFISGREVPFLLKQGPFSERQSLTIAWHLYRILDILHTRLKKSFIDLKFENLWWVENDGKWGGQLKLTDFGTLEEIKGEQKRGISRDVLLGGVYLLSMITRHTLEYSIGELKEKAEPILKHHGGKMTWGLQRLLGKLLHRNISARPKTAAEVQAEVRQLVNFWSQTDERLSAMAQNYLKTAEDEAEKTKSVDQPLSKAGYDAAIRAYSSLDILRIKAPGLFNERDLERAKAVLSIGDYFERGYALLQGRSFTLARQTFEEGILWADEPALLRRWSYTARIGEEVAPSDFESRFGELKSILDFINDNAPNPGKWQSARRDFSDLAAPSQDKPSLRSKGLDYLIAECELYELYEMACSFYIDEEFENAAEQYGMIKIILDDRLPLDAAKFIEEEIGSVPASRRNAEKRSSKEKAFHLYEDARNAFKRGELSIALEAASQAFAVYQTITHNTFHLENLSDLALLAIETGAQHPEKIEYYLRASRQIAEIGLYNYAEDTAYDRICEASVKLDSATEKISIFDTASYCALLEDAHAALGGDGALIETVANYAVKRAISGKAVPFLRGVADLVEKLIPTSHYPAEWRLKADEIFSEQAAQRHTDVDDLLQAAHQALLPILPDPNHPGGLQEILQETARLAVISNGFELLSLQNRVTRLEKARTALEKAAKIIGEEDIYRREEIAPLWIAVEKGLELALETVSVQEQTQREERIARLQALSRERAEIEKRIQIIRLIPQSIVDESVHGSIDPLSLRQKLIDFLYRCYYFESGDRESSQDTIQRLKMGTPISVTEQVSVQVLIDWAIHSLDMLGAESWRKIAAVAAGHQQKIEAEFLQAAKAFAEGEFGILAAELDRTQAVLGVTPEWQSLKSSLAQASAWKAWCETKADIFQSGVDDKLFLRDLRAFSSLGLPPIYWNQSPAPAFLDKAEDGLRQEIHRAKNINTREFFESMFRLLDVNWTKHAASTSVRRAWIKQDWLTSAYAVAGKPDLHGLTTQISQTLPPENIEEALNSFEYGDWMRLNQQGKKNKGRGSTLQSVLLLGAGVLVIICLAMLIIGVFVYPGFIPGILQKNTNTPTPSLTPTATFTPTPTVIPSLTPTVTPSLTPVPPSIYLPGDINSLYPGLPVTGDAYWVINNTYAILEPSLDAQQSPWRKAISQDSRAKEEGYFYTAVGKSTVVWAMDVPFDTTGYYELYVVDTFQQSKGPQQFQILLDGQLVQPYRGTSQVILRGSGEVNRSDTWISLGTYQVNAGQKLSVSVTLGELTDQTPFAVDRVLIVRLNESNWQMLDALPAGRTLASLMDDSTATFFEVVDSKPVAVKDRGNFFTDVKAWNGSFTSRSLTEATVPIWVDWMPVNRLSPGTYEVLVWIPENHATVVVDYVLLADNKIVERPNPAQVNQSDHKGVWWTLGTWTLEKESVVSLRMIVADGALGDIGVDAAAIVSVGQ